MKLIELIKANVGDDLVDDEYLNELGYDDETLNDPVEFYGTIWDGLNRAKVYKVSCGGYHISTCGPEYYTDDDPANNPENDFQEA